MKGWMKEMTILEKEISLILHSNNIKYYESKNYEIPREVKFGKFVVPKGSKIMVKIDDLPDGSNVIVTKICDDCGEHIQNQRYNQILIQRKNSDGKDRCKQCGLKLANYNQKNNVQYEKSAEFWAKVNNKEYLLREFSDKNVKKLNQISHGSDDIFLWNCPDCKSEYLMKIVNRTSGNSNCPFCVGQKINHTNCLWTTHPRIANLLKYPERGYEINAGRNKKEIFICDKCGFEQKNIVNDITNRGFKCRKCSDGFSYPEKLMFNVLLQLNLYFETQESFIWSRNKKYDFYIPSLNLIIETHGEQHYKESFSKIGGRTLKEEQENDRLKEKMARENGIEHYIIIDCRESNLDFIKNNILSSDLSIIFNLSNIDWLKCHECACKSLVKAICDLWNSGIKNTTEIRNIINLSYGTIRKYLKQGSEIGWCDYNSREEMIKSNKENAKSKTRGIVQISLNGKVIKEFISLSEASRETNINITSILKTCQGKHNTAGGFKWMYKENYKNVLNQSSN